MFYRTPFLLSALWACSLAPALAQCGPGHSGHGGHGSNPGQGKHDDAPKKITATNTLCPVMGRPVKPERDREVVVGERTYLVCCDGCGPELAEHKDKYLDKEGRPLNAPKKSEEKPSEPAAPKEHHDHGGA